MFIQRKAGCQEEHSDIQICLIPQMKKKNITQSLLCAQFLFFLF